MRCEEFELHAPQWMEGERMPEAVAHRETCSRCRAVIADLEAIVSAARVLPEVDPPERIWTSLRMQIEAEGLLRPQTSVLERLREVLPAMPRLVLATAAFSALAALFLLAPLQPVAVRRLASAGQASPAGAAWNLPRVQAELASAEAEASLSASGEDPLVVASYQQNLALVDKAIGVCQKQVDEDPDNDLARDYLMTAYQQKAELVTALSGRSGQGD